MPTIPFRVATFNAWPTDGTGFYCGATYDINNDVLTVTSQPGPGSAYVRAQYRINGTPIGTPTTNAGSGGAPIFTVRNLNGTYWASHGEPNWWSIPNPGDPTQLIVGPPGGGFEVSAANVYINNSIYSAGNSSGLTRISREGAPGGVPNGISQLPLGALDALYSPSEIAVLGTSDTGHLYVMVPTTGSVTDVKLWKFNAALTLVHFWDVPATIGTDLNASGNFFVYQNLICCKQRIGGVGGFTYVVLVKINPDMTLSDYGTPLLDANTTQNFTVQLTNCLGMTEFGTFSLCNNQPMVWQSP